MAATPRAGGLGSPGTPKLCLRGDRGHQRPRDCPLHWHREIFCSALSCGVGRPPGSSNHQGGTPPALGCRTLPSAHRQDGLCWWVPTWSAVHPVPGAPGCWDHPPALAPGAGEHRTRPLAESRPCLSVCPSFGSILAPASGVCRGGDHGMHQRDPPGSPHSGAGLGGVGVRRSGGVTAVTHRPGTALSPQTHCRRQGVLPGREAQPSRSPPVLGRMVPWSDPA